MYVLTATTDGINHVYLHVKNQHTGSVSMSFTANDATEFRNFETAERLAVVVQRYMRRLNRGWSVDIDYVDSRQVWA